VASDKRTIDTVLLILWALSLIGVLIDLIDLNWLKTLSSGFLFIGIGAVIRWRRYRSERWKHVAWISFVVAIAALLYRLAMWYSG
jgi:O-antigen/teichoic acid export membrane protein